MSKFYFREGLDIPYFQGEKINYFHIPYLKINSNFFEDYNGLANIFFNYWKFGDDISMKLKYEYCKN